MTNQRPNRKPAFSTYQLALMGILTAISSVLFLPAFEIPIVAFYKLDFSNVPIMLGAFSMGPLQGAVMMLLKALIGLTHSSSSGVGELADFLMGCAFILPASLLYHRKKTQNTALFGMIAGIAVMVVAGVLANKYIMIPFYMGAYHMDMSGILNFTNVAGVDSEWKLLLTVTGPFNLLKGAVLTLITFFIYKPLSPMLKGTFGRRQ